MHQPRKSLKRRLRAARRAVRNAFISALTRPVVSLLGALSPSAARRLARTVAACAGRFHIDAIKISEQNLAIAFPHLNETERRDLARSAFEHSVLLAWETMRILKHPELVSKLVLPIDQQLIENMSSEPSIVCIPHLGNWEILAQAIPLQGVTCSAVAETLNNASLDKLITRAREHNGLKIILRTGAARKVLGALKHNEAVGLLVDQNLSPREGGVFADFFGLPASTVPLPALLARKLRVRVYVVASVRTQDGHFKIIQCPMPKPVTDYACDQDLTQDIMAAFETMIRDYPDQYTWTYKRWRYLPCNVPEDRRGKFPPYAEVKSYELQSELLAKLLTDKP